MADPTNDFAETVVERLDGRPPRYSRTVLRFFRDRSTAVATVDDLAAFVREQDPPDDETRIAIRLHHVTLPKLADAGLVEYDAERNTARYRGRSAENRRR